MEKEKLERIMARASEIPRPTMNDFVALEDVTGPISAGDNGQPRVKFSQLRFLTARLLSKLGETVTPEEVGELPVDHPLFTRAMAKAQEGGIPTEATGG